MAANPPYIAELPLRLPEAAPFRLFPGQLLRARVTAVTSEEVTLDLGYTSLTAKSAGSNLQLGQRVTIQVGTIGPGNLSLRILPLASPTLPTVPPTPAELLNSLGLPSDDPLLALATQLSTQPAATGIPQPVLAALVLAFGGQAGELLGPIAKLLRGAGERGALPAEAATLASQGDSVEQLAALLHKFSGGEQIKAPELSQFQSLASQASGDPAAALSLALSALASHPVRYHAGDSPAGSLILEDLPHRGSGAPPAARFVGAVDLPILGAIGLQALSAPSVCLARITALPAAHAALAPQLELAEATLSARLGRPVAIALQAGVAENPLAVWLGEQPWTHRGLSGPGQGEWLDRKA